MKRGMRGIAAILCAALLAATAVFATSCNGKATPEEGAQLRIASMKGATSVGMASLMQAAEDEATDGGYATENICTFTVEASAEPIVALIAKGEIDIALVPANLAATLYQKTNGAISVIDINTLGVLYAVSQNGAFTSVESLRGATVYMTGLGAVPQYTLDALLGAAGMAETDLNIEFKSEPAEVVAAISVNPDAVGILPQPYVAASTTKNPKLTATMDLTEQWNAVMGADAGQCVTGVTIVRNEVLAQYPQAVAAFLADHKTSAQTALDKPADVAQVVANLGIIDSPAIAEKAIPACNIVCLTGDEMKTALQGYLQTLYNLNPASVGGQLPDDAFYYVGK